MVGSAEDSVSVLTAETIESLSSSALSNGLMRATTRTDIVFGISLGVVIPVVAIKYQILDIGLEVAARVVVGATVSLRAALRVLQLASPHSSFTGSSDLGELQVPIGEVWTPVDSA